MSSTKEPWSRNRYAWTYAVSINVMIMIYSATLYFLNIYQNAAFRAVYLLFVLLGLVLLVWNWSKNHPAASYMNAFKLCIKTGLFFLVILLPIVLLYMVLNPEAVQLVQVMETHTPSNTIQQMVGMLFFEMVPAIILSAICASFLTGWNKNRT
ncbi:hypothetical protein RQM65_01690 [Pricia sp. S334]|uniref:DUF4199 domain-containing protein n=1 Tax=Pricia mediterranea TaxID=3076079 RepID=A0ABU3L0Y3_9FLAO|nr:hypothetical protein [Pricia sp. S334]MDT7827375.1 hypothetical protein [Pricia sp. S334]